MDVIPRAAPDDSNGQTVLLLHGLMRTSLSFLPMQRRLEREGFQPIRWSYPSLCRSIEDHGAALRERIGQLDADPSVSRIHLVGHSLGGIVARQALAEDPPDKAGRVVTLASPNRGARRATVLAPLLGWLARPLPQLLDRADSFVNRIGLPDGIEFGNIAARWDGKIAARETHFDGETDHLVVGGTHTFIMCRADVLAQVVTFLRTGRFERSRD